jgi:hypothetical protein
VLVLSGWVDWADGSTFLSAAQETRGGLTPPYLQMKDERGQWKTVIEDMGMPAGKPKTMAVDLTGKWISSSREVRIVTNLCVYWDEIFLGDEAGAAVVTTPVPSLAAGLRFRGFSANHVHPERKQPEVFTYANPSPISMWNPTPGNYTRYGDVKELLDSVDDKLVIMGSGDELRLSSPPHNCHRSAQVAPGISCCWWMAGPRTGTRTPPIRRARSRCRSTPCPNSPIRRRNTTPATRPTIIPKDV